MKVGKVVNKHAGWNTDGELLLLQDQSGLKAVKGSGLQVTVQPAPVCTHVRQEVALSRVSLVK